MRRLIYIILTMAMLLAGCAQLPPSGISPPEGPAGDTAAGSTEDLFTGQWEDKSNGATLDIRKDEEGVYHGMATWTKASDDVSFWEFSGRMGNGFLEVYDCSREDVIYDDIKGDTDIWAYEGAGGKIESHDGALKWIMENDGDTTGWSFTR